MEAAADGQDKVIAAAQHIVKSLATSKNAAEDMIRILSGFDDRLSALSPNANPNPNPNPNPNSEAELRKAMDRIERAEKVIMQWDSSDSLIFESSNEVILQYFAAVDDLIAISESDFPSQGSSSSSNVSVSVSVRVRASNGVQVAMARLEEELPPLLIRNTVPLDASGLSCSLRRLSLSFPPADYDNDTSSEFEGGDPNTPTLAGPTPRHPLLDDPSLELVKSEGVEDLRDLAERMIRAGYGKELAQVYCSIRKDVLNEYLSILGVERLSIDEVQRMEWRHLDEKSKKWIQGVKIVIRGLLSSERRLSETVFSSSDELQEECFVEITKGCVLQLLNFGDAIAIIPRSAEKLFRILDVYEVVNKEILPELRVLFPGQSGESIYSEGECILKRLSDTVKGILNDFGKQVKTEASRRPMPGGEIHPLTRYVMNYMRLLVVYSETLEGLLGEERERERERVETDDENLGSMTPYGRKLYDLISYLEENLGEKSKLYEDGGLQCVFLMNNILYIYNKSKDSELGRVLGDQWLRRRRGKIRQYFKTYLRVSWTKTLSFLRDDGLSSSSGSSGSSGGSSRLALKEKFKNFNLAFEELYRVQSAWKVPDPQLREEIKISISEHVIPAYRAFLGRYGGQIDSGRHATRYIKYTTEDLESHLSDLFEGQAGVANLPKRRV